MEKELLKKAQKRQDKWQRLSRRWGVIYYATFLLGLFFSGAAIALSIFESTQLDIISSVLSFVIYGIIIEIEPAAKRSKYNEAYRLVDNGVLKYGNDDIEDEEIIQILEESEDVVTRK